MYFGVQKVEQKENEERKDAKSRDYYGRQINPSATKAVITHFKSYYSLSQRFCIGMC